MLIVSSKGPVFSIPAAIVNKIITVTDQELRGHFSLFFFYSFDFSMVCPSELHELQKKLPEFAKRDVRVYGISVDSIYTHLRWLETPVEQSGVQGITFPLISDMSNELSNYFNILSAEEGVSLRATFIVDKEYTIQYGAINALGFGRNIDEILRAVDAIQFSQEHG